MNEIIKSQWVAALRSGQYTQGRGALRRRSEYCCLGVLCELHRISTGAPADAWQRVHKSDTSNSGLDPMEAYLGATDLLPAEVTEWAQVGSPNPDVGMLSNERCSLAKLNDSRVPFATIANLIERDL